MEMFENIFFVLVGVLWNNLRTKLNSSFNWEATILDALGMNITLEQVRNSSMLHLQLSL